MRSSYLKTSFNLFILIVAFAFTASASPPPIDDATDQEKLVRDFVAAFNSRNIDVMLTLVDDNIEWLQIDGVKLIVNTAGKAALRESMTRYFRSCGSCKSTLEWLKPAGDRATAMERASWSGKQGPKSQRGLSVYEFKDGKILRVYYFPAEAVQATGGQD